MKKGTSTKRRSWKDVRDPSEAAALLMAERTRNLAHKRRQKLKGAVRRVVDALHEGLRFKAIVATARIPGTVLHRVYVLAEAFESMQAHERQDYVWRVVNRSVRPADQNMISMIVTATLAEMGLFAAKPGGRRK